MPQPSPSQDRPLRLFARGSFLESSRVAEVLRGEATGGMLLIAGAIFALVWANTPWSDSYASLRDFRVGPESLHLDLSLGAWAADGLLAVFFFVVGLELKREFVAGDLRDPRRAALPVAAACGGMLAPALIYAAVNGWAGNELRGWAIPTATDIAFALAVLAVVGSNLPSAVRAFLLTLAVVDDLLAITIIAIFYTDELHVPFLLLAVVPIALFAVLVQRRVRTPLLLLPLAAAAWLLVHESGIHATIAGVLLGFTVPVLRRDGAPGKGYAEHLEHIVRPISAGVAVPIFAFFAAGVTVGSLETLRQALTQPVALGVVTGLVLGKVIGITGSTWLLARFTRAELDDELSWLDVVGMSMLGGIGFTVSLLVAELAYQGTEEHEYAKVGVLVGSLVAALLAAVVLRARNRVYRRLYRLEQVDANANGVPDVFEDPRDG